MRPRPNRCCRLGRARSLHQDVGQTSVVLLLLAGLQNVPNELKQAAGATSLYNESLGTTSDSYMYDRVKGRDLPVAERPVPAWKLPPTT